MVSYVFAHDIVSGAADFPKVWVDTAFMADV